MKNFIIIGNSAAGIAAIEAIRKIDTVSKITVISDEEYPAYCRCLISYYLAGQTKEKDIFYRTESFYRAHNVELLLNKKVARVDPKKGRVVLRDRNQRSFDGLLIATGATPKIPEAVKGIKKTGVFGLRTLQDAKAIAELLPVTKAAFVLGGGLVGLKTAYALRKKRIDVKVVVKSKQILSQILDYDGASFVQRRLQENGIDILLGQDITEIIGEGEIRAVKLDSGKAYDCSMVIVGKGVSPNIDLIKDTEIKVNEGIVADSSLQTSVPSIYAAGDVCESLDLTRGAHAVNALWPVAVEQGKIAGTNMAGGNLRYDGSLGMNSLEFFGLPTISLGIYRPEAGEKFEELKKSDPGAQVYKKLLLKDNHLVGAVLVGDIKSSGAYLRLIRERIDCSSIKDMLLQEDFGYPHIVDFVKEKENVYV
ncbi:MAG: FAD-dependent oxidoreductase [Candidatus Omnitrophica bacterium]|nr:FAD-dependent oxidoreductase [Candidatus Omnitrophota bacterium]